MTERSLHRHARTTALYVAQKIEMLPRRQIALGVLALAMILQLAATGIDLTGLFENGHMNAANLIGVGGFVIGCIAALFLKRRGASAWFWR